MSNLDEALTAAQQLVSDTATVLHRALAVRQRLEGTSGETAADEAERLVYVTLATALQNGLHEAFRAVVMALRAANREGDSPSDRWLRQQLDGLAE